MVNVLDKIYLGITASGNTRVRAKLACSTKSEMPAQDGGVPGLFLDDESLIHVRQDAEVYAMDGGTWVLQYTMNAK